MPPPFPLCFLVAAFLFLISGSYACHRRSFLRASPAYPPPAKQCADCHPRCYAEWNRSSHRSAWSDEAYRSRLDEVVVTGCLGCHVPGLMTPHSSAESRPEARVVLFEEGVNCWACHSDACPEVLTDRNDVSPPGDEREPGRCDICHEDTGLEWKSIAKDGSSKDHPLPRCVDCHMPLTKDGEDRVAKGAHRDHSMHLPDAKIRFEIKSLRQTKGGDVKVGVTIFLDGMGHALPTGHYGSKEVRIEAWFDDRTDGRCITRRFFVERKDALRPGENGPYDLFFHRAGRTLHLRAVYRKGGLNDAKDKVLAVLSVSLSKYRSAGTDEREHRTFPDARRPDDLLMGRACPPKGMEGLNN